VNAFRAHDKALVTSRLFDCFGNAWDSILLSLLDDELLQGIVECGFATFAYEMVARMNNRFSYEFVAVAKSSNVFKRKFFGLFAVSPTTDQIMMAVRAGKFKGLAQTDAFINRVMTLKTCIDEVLVRAQSFNIYLPMYITQAQRTLPIHGRTPLGSLADGSMVSQRSARFSRDFAMTRDFNRKGMKRNSK